MPTRRTLLIGGAGLTAQVGFAGSLRADPVATAVTPPIVTRDGPVIGWVSDGIATFRGVRYGAPPVGPLRFMPPRPPQRWTEPAAALHDGHAAMQLSSGGGAARFPGTVGVSLAQGMDSAEDAVRQDEDCLFLNVWSPGLDRSRRPVMVWLHGGGFNYGSGSWAFYDGHNLAKRHDVVVVTLNHRLNIFGYLELGAQGAPGSGNAGMLDLVLALEWVRDSISSFGGDPDRVTIFGQSGGGAKVSTLMAMPRAKGLFHRGIIESGPGLRGADQSQSEATARAIMTELGAFDLQALQRVPAERLLAAARARETGGLGLRWGPVVDGTVLPANPFEPTASPLGASVPVMVGCTANEQTLYNVGQPWWGKLTTAELEAKVAVLPGGKGPAVLAAFRRLEPDHDPSYLYTDVTGAMGAFIGSVRLAERKAAQAAAPVWFYIWRWPTPGNGGILKAPHTTEIPFVFDNVEKGPLLLGTAPSTRVLATLASDTWARFARTGDPNGAGLPRWPAYEASGRATLLWDTRPQVSSDAWGEVRRALEA